jgi:hypothetical protein
MATLLTEMASLPKDLPVQERCCESLHHALGLGLYKKSGERTPLEVLNEDRGEHGETAVELLAIALQQIDPEKFSYDYGLQALLKLYDEAAKNRGDWGLNPHPYNKKIPGVFSLCCDGGLWESLCQAIMIVTSLQIIERSFATKHITSTEQFELKRGIVCGQGWEKADGSKSYVRFTGWDGWKASMASGELYYHERLEQVRDYPPPGSFNATALAQKSILARRASDLYCALFQLSNILEAVEKFVALDELLHNDSYDPEDRGLVRDALLHAGLPAMLERSEAFVQQQPWKMDVKHGRWRSSWWEATADKRDSMERYRGEIEKACTRLQTELYSDEWRDMRTEEEKRSEIKKT